MQFARLGIAVLICTAVACDSETIRTLAPAGDGSGAPSVAAVLVSPSTVKVLVGGVTQLSAIPRDGNGNPVPNTNIKWTSSDPTIASVSEGGSVTAQKSGTSKITASAGTAQGTADVVVADVPVASVNVTLPVSSVTVGQTTQAATVLKDANGALLSGRVIAWASSNANVATVSNAGLVTGVAPGTVDIIATSEGISGSSSLSVTPVPVASVSVVPAAFSLSVGSQHQLAATALDANGQPLSGRTFSWSSSNSGIASVSSSGLVTAHAAGSANIIASSEGKSGQSVATVSDAAPAPVETVAVSLASSSISVGEGTQATATLRDASGNILGGRVVTWATSNASVATINSSGYVNAVAAGSATITATSEGKAGSAALQVNAPAPQVASVLVDPESATIDALGYTVQLTATAKDANGSVLSGVSFVWTSLNTGVATVSTAGKVTAKAVGTALVIAASGLIADTATITVRQVPTTMALSTTSLVVMVGSTAQLTATVKDAGGSAIPNTPIAWSSSASGVASVSSSGLVTGVSPGAATITAASGTLSAQAAVDVREASAVVSGFWISRDELMTRPTSGAPWTALLADASSNPGTADVSNQDSNHDVLTLAAALVCVRTNEFCAKARQGVVDAIGTEQGGRWLAVGRNMLAYVIAADLLGLRADGNAASDGSRVQAWIASFLTMKLAHNNSGEPWPLIPFESGSNASAQEGAVYAAIGAYLNDRTVLERGWDAFRTYACDPSAPDREKINLSAGIAAGWAHDDAKPCAINPLGTSKMVPAGLPGAGTVRRIDGAIINDMRRGGDYQWPPGYTQYPWIGLEGAVAAAVILHRAGYPAFEVADRAMLRTHEYLWYLRENTGNIDWFDGTRADEVRFIINIVYGKSFPTSSGVGGGRTFGYSDWSHMTWRK